ncbi:MAG: hypothetical protein SGJ21_02155 [Alphaproteobacteria bacterium]|nr:hypothetical protein [Alphaproteobacteria bacterium]
MMYSEWRSLFENDWCGVWAGPVRTPLATYKAKIQVIRNMELGEGDIEADGVNPVVTVTEPALRLYPGAKRLPHTFHADRPPETWPLLHILSTGAGMVAE